MLRSLLESVDSRRFPLRDAETLRRLPPEDVDQLVDRIDVYL